MLRPFQTFVFYSVNVIVGRSLHITVCVSCLGEYVGFPRHFNWESFFQASVSFANKLTIGEKEELAQLHCHKPRQATLVFRGDKTLKCG